MYIHDAYIYDHVMLHVRGGILHFEQHSGVRSVYAAILLGVNYTYASIPTRLNTAALCMHRVHDNANKLSLINRY